MIATVSVVMVMLVRMSADFHVAAESASAFFAHIIQSSTAAMSSSARAANRRSGCGSADIR